MNDSKYILGTANLGQKYGLRNESEYNFQDSQSIIEYALLKGLKSFDTSPDYGLAHKLLANNIGEHSEIKISTKISTKILPTPDQVVKKLEESLTELQVNEIDTILFHDPDAYLLENFSDLVEAILGTGKVNNVGVSVYNKVQVLKSLEKSSLLKKFQVPENILDRRLITDPEINLLKSQGISFEVRSIFLQGLILSPLPIINHKFSYLNNYLFELRDYAKELSTSLIALCLNYAQRIKWSDGTIVAASSIHELDEILCQKSLGVDLDLERLPSLPANYLDPRFW